MSNDLAGSTRFGSTQDVPRTVIEALRLSDSLNAMSLRYLSFIESASSEIQLAYAHGRADGWVEGLNEGGALKGQQSAVLQNAFQSAYGTRNAQLQSNDS